MIVKGFSAPCHVALLLTLVKMTVSYTIFERQLVRIIVLSLRVNGSAPNMPTKSLKVVNGPSSIPDGGDPDTYCQKGVQHSTFRYITYVLFSTLHDAIGNSSLYE